MTEQNEQPDLDDEVLPDDLTEEDAEDLEALLGDVDSDAADTPILDDGEEA